MLSISFGWTWPAFVAWRKSVTRRNWKPRYAAMFRPGVEFVALNKDRRYGGVEIGRGRITSPVMLEPLAIMPDSDYDGEGFRFFAEHPELLPPAALKRGWSAGACSRESFNAWRSSGESLYVVRFNILSVTAEDIEHLAAEGRA